MLYHVLQIYQIQKHVCFAYQDDIITCHQQFNRYLEVNDYCGSGQCIMTPQHQASDIFKGFDLLLWYGISSAVQLVLRIDSSLKPKSVKVNMYVYTVYICIVSTKSMFLV